jgi:hypothetical protein
MSVRDAPVPTFPWPKGTLVKGWYKDSGGPFKLSCERHVFEIVTDPEPVDWGNSGYCQAARCLYCGGSPTAKVDSYFWWTQVTPMDLVEFLGALTEAADWFAGQKDKVFAMLHGKPKQALRDFG